MTEPVSQNIVRAEGSLGPLAKSDLLGHGAITAWFTGLSGSGKSTLAFAVEDQLVKVGVLAYVLDGDNVRFGLNRDLGFSPADREENIRRIGEVCRLMTDAGVVVLSSFISPYRLDREVVRSLHPPKGFVEVFVDTPLEVCEERDVKGLYKKARAGEIPEFSGISAPYEAPENAEIRIDTSRRSIQECANLVVEEILNRIRTS